MLLSLSIRLVIKKVGKDKETDSPPQKRKLFYNCYNVTKKQKQNVIMLQWYVVEYVATNILVRWLCGRLTLHYILFDPSDTT